MGWLLLFLAISKMVISDKKLRFFFVRCSSFITSILLLFTYILFI